MKRTVNEWVKFLAIDENQMFGIEKFNSRLLMKITDYLPAEKFLEVFTAYGDDEVEKMYYDNLVRGEKHFHLLQIKG